jgi:hypothetical protein
MLANEVNIKRGQPLAYIKFRSKNPQDLFKLVKQDRTAELEHLVNSSITVKSYQPNLSWQIVNGNIPNNLRNGKVLVKKEPWICKFFRFILRK